MIVTIEDIRYLNGKEHPRLERRKGHRLKIVSSRIGDSLIGFYIDDSNALLATTPITQKYVEGSKMVVHTFNSIFTLNISE